MSDQPVHPIELVGIFFGIRRVAVRQIDGSDPHDMSGFVGNGRLDVAGMQVGFVTWQAARDFDGRFERMATPFQPFWP